MVAVGSFDSVDKEPSYVLANPPRPAMEISVDAEEVSVLGTNLSGETQFSKPKKAKLSENVKISDQVSHVSPVLHHKIPRSKTDDDSEDSDEKDEVRAQTNLFGVNFWFGVRLELRGRILWIKRKKTGEEKLSLGFTRKLFCIWSPAIIPPFILALIC